jgi:hypothetical protein
MPSIKWKNIQAKTLIETQRQIAESISLLSESNLLRIENVSRLFAFPFKYSLTFVHFYSFLCLNLNSQIHLGLILRVASQLQKI